MEPSPCSEIPGCLRFSSTSKLLDTDANGTTDNDRDSDNDGLGNYIDLDSDNDGIADVIEANGIDIDGDGYADNFTDLDLDGYNDVYDTPICSDTGRIEPGTYVDASSSGDR